MAGNDSSKGNPASHRMSNPHRKDRCSRAHARTEKRKELRKANVAEREKYNKGLRASGCMTAWDKAKLKRRADRAHLQPTG